MLQDKITFLLTCPSWPFCPDRPLRSALIFSTMALKKLVDFFGKKEKPKNFKSGFNAGKNAEKAKYQFSQKPAVSTESKICENAMMHLGT